MMHILMLDCTNIRWGKGEGSVFFLSAEGRVVSLLTFSHSAFIFYSSLVRCIVKNENVTSKSVHWGNQDALCPYAEIPPLMADPEKTTRALFFSIKIHFWGVSKNFSIYLYIKFICILNCWQVNSSTENVTDSKHTADVYWCHNCWNPGAADYS